MYCHEDFKKRIASHWIFFKVKTFLIWLDSYLWGCVKCAMYCHMGSLRILNKQKNNKSFWDFFKGKNLWIWLRSYVWGCVKYTMYCHMGSLRSFKQPNNKGFLDFTDFFKVKTLWFDWVAKYEDVCGSQPHQVTPLTFDLAQTWDLFNINQIYW